MELLFELVNAKHFVPKQFCRKTFTRAGGVIGRGPDCDWVIPDRKRHLSNQHARVTYQAGGFFLTDISSNGIRNAEGGMRLPRRQPVRIEDGSAYVLGEVEIRAQLPQAHTGDMGLRRAAGDIIPEDVFLGIDSLKPLAPQLRGYSGMEVLLSPEGAEQSMPQCADYARVDTERLIIPELVKPARAMPEPEQACVTTQKQSDGFWERFADALGLDLQPLDQEAREAVAVNTARLFRHSIAGLKQGLHTRSALRTELRICQAPAQDLQENPVKEAPGTTEALELLLRPVTAGQLGADDAIALAFRDLQAHQLALVAASRAAVRGALAHFSPQQLALRFEGNNPPLINSSRSRWKAYVRYHQALCQDDDWCERFLACDFAQAYQEQARLISTLPMDLHP